MHNYYTYLYNKTVFELLEDFHGKGNALVFARSATGGSQKFPVHWGGDCDATFESMAEDLRGGLSFCLSGPAFWSHDIGGFNGTAHPAVYKRWIAFGLLSTHSRLHGSGSYRVPWLFDEESVEVMRHFTRLKNRLFPYLFAARRMRTSMAGRSCARCCSNSRTIRRAGIWIGNTCSAMRSWSRRSFARMTSPNITCRPGKWTDLQTGKVTEGGQWRREKFDFFSLPLFVKENSIVPMSENDAEPGWALKDALTLNLFQIADGADIQVRLASKDDGIATFRCRRSGSKITIESDGKARNVRVMLRSTRAASAVVNGKVARSARWLADSTGAIPRRR